jgi:hypothetical protein
MNPSDTTEANLFALIESWVPENIDLALTLASKKPKWKKAIKRRYKPILKLIAKGATLDWLAGKDWVLEGEKCLNVEYTEELEAVFQTLPWEELVLLNCTKIPWWLGCCQKLKILELDKVKAATMIFPLPDSSFPLLEELYIKDGHDLEIHENIKLSKTLIKLKIENFVRLKLPLALRACDLLDELNIKDCSNLELSKDFEIAEDCEMEIWNDYYYAHTEISYY